MKNGWYKIEYGKNDYWANSDYWPPNDEIVCVENDIITESRDEWGKKWNGPQVKVVVTSELKKCMIRMEFDGIGCA